MFKVRVIPCLDVKDGRVVKGVNFVDLRDAGDPVEAAIAYDAAGADELCFLDITATHENRGIMLDVVRRTAEACFMPLTVGGGVRTVDDIKTLLRSGADKVSINSAAVSRREFVKEAAEKFGEQCIVVAIDAKRVKRGGGSDRWEIFTHGGRNSTGIDAIEYAQEVVSLGAGEILLTSMDRDGTRQGFDLPLTQAIADSVPRTGNRLRRRRQSRSPRRRHPPGPCHRGHAAPDQPAHRADLRPDLARRPRRHPRRPRAAAPRDRLRDPADRALPAPHVEQNVATVPALLGWDKAAHPRPGSTSCSTSSGLEPGDVRATATRTSCPAASSSASASPGRSRADPPVLLMDEPFGAVDPIARDRLQEQFLRIQAELHKTVVFVTHDIDEAVRLGDRIAVLGPAGQLEQYADPAHAAGRAGERVRRRVRRRRPRHPPDERHPADTGRPLTDVDAPRGPAHERRPPGRRGAVHPARRHPAGGFRGSGRPRRARPARPRRRRRVSPACSPRRTCTRPCGAVRRVAAAEHASRGPEA